LSNIIFDFVIPIINGKANQIVSEWNL
jgi:hypothetical protein